MSRAPRPVLSLFLLSSSMLSHNASAMTLGQIATTAASAHPAAFESTETVATGVEDRTPQWQQVKRQLGKDMAQLQHCLDDATNCTGSAIQMWRAMVTTLTEKDANTKLQTVNVFFNRWQYRADEGKDHWAGPIEFMQNSGDCEEYAIAKYTTLLFLGMRDEQMRITAVQDMNRGGIAHAVLSVTTENGNEILDNLSDIAYDGQRSNGYVPRFAVNQSSTYTYSEQPRFIYASLSVAP